MITPAMTAPPREVQTQNSQETPKEPKRQKVQVKRAKKSDTKNNKGNTFDKRKDKLPFLSFVPRKKLPFVSNNDEGKDHCLTGNKSRSLEDALRGTLGYQAVFMPAPGHNPFRPAGGAPPLSSYPSRSSQSESMKSSA